MSKITQSILFISFLILLFIGTLTTPTIGFDGGPRPGCLPGDQGPCPPGK